MFGRGGNYATSFNLRYHGPCTHTALGIGARCEDRCGAVSEYAQQPNRNRSPPPSTVLRLTISRSLCKRKGCPSTNSYRLVRRWIYGEPTPAHTRILVDYGNDLYLIPIKTVFVLFLSFPFLPYRFSSPYRSWYSVLSYVFPKLEKFETNELVPIEVYIAVSGVGDTFARERDAIKPRKSVDESSMRGSLKMTLLKRRRNGKPMYEVE